MELNVYKIDGTKTNQKVKLNPEVFGIEPNDHVVYLAIKTYLANQRQGTHQVKKQVSCIRWRCKTISPEGNRTCPTGNNPGAAHGWWGRSTWSPSPGLHPEASQKGSKAGQEICFIR